VQKFFTIAAFLLLSATAAAAQTASEPKALSSNKPEFANRAETARAINARPAPVLNAGTTTSRERKQVVRVVDGRVLRLGPTTTYLKNGLTTEEVIRLLGKPVSISELREGLRLLTVYTFTRSDGRVFIAEFEKGLLVDSRMEPAVASSK
jgi:hypothetical protein